jgi:hypothetical protein
MFRGGSQIKTNIVFIYRHIILESNLRRSESSVIRTMYSVTQLRKFCVIMLLYYLRILIRYPSILHSCY